MDNSYITCGNSILYVSNRTTPANFKENGKIITPLIEKHFKTLKNIEEFNITKKSIFYFRNKRWESIDLTVADQKLIKNICKTTPILRLKHDEIGEKIAEEIKKQNIPTLYLYSSGGGGHKSAKDAKLETYLAKILENVQLQFNETHSLQKDDRLKNLSHFTSYCKKMNFVQEVDVLHDYLGKIGKWSSKQWDHAQMTGNVLTQESLASKQWLSDLFFGPIVFFATLNNLKTFKPKSIISTQAMATPSILFAIQIYNCFYKPEGTQDVKLHLYMTDMPTEYSGHFFDSLKRLTKRGGKDYLILHAPKPKNDTDWQILCHLPNGQVEELTTDELPVRPAFLQAATHYQSSIKPLVKLKLNHPEESKLLSSVLHHQDSQFNDSVLDHSTNSFQYSMKSDDEGYFLMLGSQPTKQAIKEYVDQFIQISLNYPNKNYHLFAFTGKFEADKDCFYKELSQYIKEKHPWPSNLRVIPLSFQDPSQLVSLELQCHTITRSGGSSIMELLVLEEVIKKLKLPAKQRFIHSQQVKGRNLEDSIPTWEKGNYLFLKNQLPQGRVEVLSPNIFRNIKGKISSRKKL